MGIKVKMCRCGHHANGHSGCNNHCLFLGCFCSRFDQVDEIEETTLNAKCTCSHSKGAHVWGQTECPCRRCKCKVFEADGLSKLTPEIESPDGGKRQRLNMRWDFIPGQFTSLSWISRVTAYGATKYSLENWKKLDPRSEQSPLNHAIGHVFEAAELEYGSLERVWALSKAAWNLLAQIWFEMRKAEWSEREVEEWFEKKMVPTTYSR